MRLQTSLPGWRLPVERLLGVVLLFLLHTSIQAAVRFDVFAGYDGILPEASWYPITCEVENDGPGFDGVVEISPGAYGQGQTRVLALELPTGTTKRFVIPVFSASRYNANWTARLLDSRGKVRAETVLNNQKVMSLRVPLGGAIARSAAGVSSLPKVRQQDLQPVMARLLPNLFPDNPIALQGLDMIYLSSEKAVDLKAPQVTALLSWLHAGGHLVVGVDQITQVNALEWLNRIMPCQLTNMVMAEKHNGLQDWLQSDRGINGTDITRKELSNVSPRRSKPALTPSSSGTVYSKLGPHNEFEMAPLQVAVGPLRDGEVLAGGDSQPLMIIATRGRGQITVLPFSPELEPFLSWKHREYFWAKVLDVPLEFMGTENINSYGSASIDGVFGAMIETRQVRKLPVGWLLVLLVGYLVVIGPLDQYWLKKINRQMLTWITFPCYVAFFSVLIYVIGYKLRAGESEWNEMHVVDVAPVGEQADLRGLSYASLYSPINAKYELSSDLPFAAFRGEYLGNYGVGQEITKAAVQQQGNGFRADVSVPVWTSQLYVHDWWTREENPLSVTVADGGQQWVVTLDNRVDKALERVHLAVDDRIYDAGKIGRMEKKTVNLNKSGGHQIRSFVADYAGNFHAAISQRQRAFGENRVQIPDPINSVAAISFISQYTTGGNQPYSGYQQFVTPPGLDLSPVLGRGHAVVLAWVRDFSPVKPIHKFSPRRLNRDTLFRVVVPIKQS